MKNAKKNMKRGLWQDLNCPCLTITSHLAKTSINSRDPLLLVDPNTELYRRFTPREAAHIQSFPENFILNPSESKSYKQIGNAIPPVLMWHIARSLQNLAENNHENLPMVSEAAEYFVSQIYEPGSYNYESNPFLGTLFNEPSLPYGKHHTY